MVSVDQLISVTHTYRRLNKLLDFNYIFKSVKIQTSKVGAHGFGKERLVICLILQWPLTSKIKNASLKYN